VGLIARGSGECVTPGDRFPLRPGLGFVIAADALHSFHTEREPLLVIAYHPDSDFGPTHECHPMVNRTIVPQRPTAAVFTSPLEGEVAAQRRVGGENFPSQATSTPHPNPPPQGGREPERKDRA